MKGDPLAILRSVFVLPAKFRKKPTDGLRTKLTLPI